MLKLKASAPLRGLAAMVCFSFCLSPLLAAPPANDNFASSIDLGSTATVNTTGTNVEATTEASEDTFNGLAGKSVWYSWTAATTGWVTVDTVGTQFDTVLGVFTGTTVGTTTLIGYNDGAAVSSERGPYHVSRLYFFAAAGTTYRLSVSGWDNGSSIEEGAFQLHLASSVPPVRVTAISMTPDPANVTAAAQDVTVAFTLETNNPATYFSVALEHGASGQQVYAEVSPLDLVGGDDTNGNYEIVVPMPRRLAPGDWKFSLSLTEIGASYRVAPSTGFTEDHIVMPLALDASLQVVNTGDVDLSSPVLTAFTASETSVDVGAGDQPVTLTFTLTDDFPGDAGGYIVLESGGPSAAFVSFSETDLISRTGNDSVYAVTALISQSASTGTYHWSIRTQDTLNPGLYYSNSPSLPGLPMPLGSSTTLEVEGAEPPVNDNFADRIVLPGNATVTTSGTNIAASMEADEGGHSFYLGNQSVWYQWTAPASGWVSMDTVGSSIDTVLAVYTGAEVDGLTKIGHNNQSAVDAEVAMHGVSRLAFLAEQGTTYQISVLSESGAGGNFSLRISPSAPPFRVTNLAASPAAVDVTNASQSVTLDVAVEADLPVTGFTIYFQHPQGTGFVTAVVSETDRVTGTGLDGTYQININFPRYASPAEWVMSASFIQDYQYYTVKVGGDAIPQNIVLPATAGGVLQVDNTGLVDTTPPELTAFTASPSSVNLTSGSQVVTATITIADEHSGFVEGSVQVFPDTFGSSAYAWFTAADLTSGDAQNGTYSVALTIPADMPSGNHYFYVMLTDGLGETSFFTANPNASGSAMPAGATTRLMVTGAAPGYDGWKNAQYFGPLALNGLLDDPNWDGTSNLASYAFNLEPYNTLAHLLCLCGTSGLPRVTQIGEGEEARLQIEFIRRTSTSGSGLTYRPQFSSSLMEGGPDGWTDASGTPEIFYINTLWERVIIEDTVQGAGLRFGRVIVDHAP